MSGVSGPMLSPRLLTNGAPQLDSAHHPGALALPWEVGVDCRHSVGFQTRHFLADT
jgi:hypothetical protein